MSLELATKRMVLRLPRMDDAARVAHFLADFGVSGNLARVPNPYYLTDAKAWLKTRHDDLPPVETVFMMDLPGEGMVGNIGFHLGASREPVLGYWLGRPFWGRGLMTEAVAASVEWLFAQTRTARILSGVFAFNAASFAIQKKLGFEEIGTSQLLCLARGQELSHIDTALTRARWIETAKP